MFNWVKNLFINEELKQFQNKNKNELTDKQLSNQQGEALEVYGIDSSYTDLSSFNLFYNNRLNKSYNNNKVKIQSYREMATMPEISDIVEDAVNESTQEDDEGNVFNLEIVNEKFLNNKNISKVLLDEFDELFNNRLDINKEIWRFFNNFYVDGVLYYERIINTVHWKEGIKNIKWLPPESMDFIYNYELNKIDAFIQYKKQRNKRPASLEEAKKDENIIVLLPEQIGFIPYKQGKTKNDIIGFLDNCKIAYNQLKLLETSVIIYRLVRAPERFVFKIDVGNMPRDKALAYVNKIKSQMNRKQTYNASTGQMEGATGIENMLDNVYLPQSDNRGSDVTTIGGNSSGFTELDDIKYFAKKLYRALKYPLSRVESSFENRHADNLFGGNSFADITRDEIKWSKVLERNQNKFCTEFKDLFLLHLDFKGIKKQYDLNKNDINIIMNPPSEYKEQMNQKILETRINNFSSLSNEESFSKVYLMKRFLKMDDEDIKLNADSFKEEEKLFPKKEGY